MSGFRSDEADAVVLVVGPDPDAAGFIAAVLSRAGITSRPALTSDAATEVMSAHPPYSVVVLDADLVALRSIRALADPRRASVPTLVLGAPDASAGAATKASEQGATAWLDRPVDESEMIDGVREMVDAVPNRGAGGDAAR